VATQQQQQRKVQEGKEALRERLERNVKFLQQQLLDAQNLLHQEQRRAEKLRNMDCEKLLQHEDTNEGSVLATTASAQVRTEEPIPQTRTSRRPLLKPDCSNLDPFAKALCVDLGSDNEKEVDAALNKIEHMCLNCNTRDGDKKNRDRFATLGGRLGNVLVLRKWTS
jgi:hypothetical protein